MFPDIETLAKRLDAKFGLPRPINEQHISDRRAFMRLTEDIGKGVSYFVASLLACYFFYLAGDALGVRLFTLQGGVVALCMFFCFLACGGDIWHLKHQYMSIFQRETFGSSRWADVGHLKQKELITPNTESPLPEAIPIATFGWKHWYSIPIKMFLRHTLVLGPPGSGKTASFFTNAIRAWSQVGGALILDISKNLGEVSRYSAHYYTDVFRFDLVNPECSDRFSLRACKRNPSLAYDIASFMIGYDSNNMARSGSNPVWPQAAVVLLKCLLLHLNEIMEDPTPSDIFKFVHDHPYDAENKIDHLKEAMLSSPYEEVRESYAMYLRGAGGDPRVSSSVFFSMSTPLEPFRDPVVRKVMSMPTDEERARGCRVIDFNALRTKGTAIYVVVKEGQASRFEAVLGTFYGIAIEVLKSNADNKGACPVMLFNDENANIPFRNMGETLATSRGRRFGFMCGYQDVTQIEKQFGGAYSKSLRQNIATRIFLPGLTDETAEFAVKMIGKTTTFQISSNDAVGRELDSERLSEVGVQMWDETKLREMLPYNQAIIITDTAHPARVGFPPPAEVVDPTETFPQRYDHSYALTKEAAEMYAIALMTPLERVINDVRPALRGEEMGLINAVMRERAQTLGAEVAAHTAQQPTGDQNPALTRWVQVPLSPYLLRVPKQLNKTTNAAPPASPATVAEDTDAGVLIGATTAQADTLPPSPLAFTDESEVRPTVAAPTRALSALTSLISEQASDTTQTPLGADHGDTAGLLSALEDAERTGVDFPI